MWDNILRTDHWDVVHSFNSALEGWLVLIVRRHEEALADLTDAEATELGPLIKRVSRALQQATGCAKTYVAQFAEQAGHNHVHVHLMARYADQPDAVTGPRIFDLLGVDPSVAVSDERKTELALRIQRHLLQR